MKKPDALDRMTAAIFNAALYTLIAIAVDISSERSIHLTMSGEDDVVRFNGPRLSYAYMCGLRRRRQEKP